MKKVLNKIVSLFSSKKKNEFVPPIPNEKMKEKLEELLKSVDDEQTKSQISRAIEKLN